VMNDHRGLIPGPRRRRFERQLTVSGVAAGVILVVCITALLVGRQRHWTALLTEAIPHVRIRVAGRTPTPLADVPGVPAGAISSRIEQCASQQKNIEHWAQGADIVRAIPNVHVVAPGVSAPAFTAKGGNPVGVAVIGADPEGHDQVTPVTANLIAGHYRGLGREEIVIDDELARDLNISVGDRIRLMSSTGDVASFTIVGVYSQGRGCGRTDLLRQGVTKPR
jgi:lipoprotein-releasing system permease protein